MNEAKDIGTSSGLRDTQTWYLDVDPLKIVDQSLVEYVFHLGGHELLDLGCGLGGYAKTLQSRGRNVIALDVNEKYVEIAKRLGVDARLYDGRRIPLDDKSVDTIFMVEVMEHIANPELLIAELHLNCDCTELHPDFQRAACLSPHAGRGSQDFLYDWIAARIVVTAVSRCADYSGDADRLHACGRISSTVAVASMARRAQARLH
jgi:SAM-dependent methyltransferase